LKSTHMSDQEIKYQSEKIYAIYDWKR